MNLNLLPSSAKFQAVKIKLQSRVKMVIVAIAVVWLIIVAAVLILNLLTKVLLDRVIAQNNNLSNNYKAMADDIVTNQNLKYKAKMVGGVLNDRFEYGKSFELIQSLFPREVVLKDYNLDEGGSFVVSGVTQTGAGVDLIEKTVADINSGNNSGLVSAKLNNLSLKGTDWNFTMEVVLK